MDYKFTSRSEEDTLELAQNIESEKFPNMVLCLEGELGSGKTVFVKGFAQALGIDENVTSPTFNLVKEYLNDLGLRKEMAELCTFLKENIASAKERRDFAREYLLEGLTDLRSNYIIRKSTLDNYKDLLERENGNYQEYYEYEKMIHRLINSSADETKSLWMEYLLVTGEENTTNLNDLQSISVYSINKEDNYGIFWTSLLIENTRLYYDSMLNFVQKASALVKNENL